MADRRPIAARSWTTSQRAADALARAGVSPNSISVAGAIFGIGGGALLASTAPAGEPLARVCFFLAAICVQCRLLANMFDGMVAVSTGKTSAVGELYNEVPDRISDAATLLGLGYAIGGDVLAGFWATLLAVMTAYIRAVVKVAGAPQDFGGPFAKQQRMFVVTVICILCAVLPDQARRLPAALGGIGLPAAALWLITAGSALTCILRLRCGAKRLIERARS